MLDGFGIAPFVANVSNGRLTSKSPADSIATLAAADYVFRQRDYSLRGIALHLADTWTVATLPPPVKPQGQPPGIAPRGSMQAVWIPPDLAGPVASTLG